MSHSFSDATPVARKTTDDAISNSARSRSTSLANICPADIEQPTGAKYRADFFCTQLTQEDFSLAYKLHKLNESPLTRTKVRRAHTVSLGALPDWTMLGIDGPPVQEATVEPIEHNLNLSPRRRRAPVKHFFVEPHE